MYASRMMWRNSLANNESQAIVRNRGARTRVKKPSAISLFSGLVGLILESTQLAFKRFARSNLTATVSPPYCEIPEGKPCGKWTSEPSIRDALPLP